MGAERGDRSGGDSRPESADEAVEARVVLEGTLRPGTRPQPADMERDATGMAIVWKDGHRSVYTYDDLRRSCPCATCRNERAQEPSAAGGLRVLPAAAAAHAVLEDVEWVGWYAFRFRWRDGHDTGIYSFEYLRDLCSCLECSAARGAGSADA
jgi:DUF971 family protein